MNKTFLPTTHWIAALALLAAVMVAQARKPAPLFDDLDVLDHPVTSDSAEARRYFNQGLVLLYGFNHNEAVRSFQAAATMDPECAMAYWGIAYAHGPNINRPMEDADVPKAWIALQSARNYAPKASPREQAYIEALTARYVREPIKDRSGLDQAYADAMKKVAEAYPDDLDAWTLYAESLMDTTPWNYWEKDLAPKPATAALLKALEHVLKRNPDHPGANHFFIHAVESGPTPRLGLPSADRLRDLDVRTGHLVHMPAHIYLRVGQYRDASIANEKAVKVDRGYIRACQAQGFYPGVYYPHNLHFLWYATAWEGRSKDSLRTARRIVNFELDNRCGPTTVVEAPRFRHLPLLVQARFGHWEDLLATPTPKDAHVFDQAMWHFARGLADIATGSLDEAARHQAALHDLGTGDKATADDNPYFPGSQLLAVADHVLTGKLAQSRQDQAAAVAALTEAVRLQDELPYMEPPYWYYPTRESLGAALLQFEQPAQAEQAFREDLAHHPRNAWGLFGLSQALREQGKDAEAARVQGEFEQAWKHADTGLELSWF